MQLGRVLGGHNSLREAHEGRGSVRLLLVRQRAILDHAGSRVGGASSSATIDVRQDTYCMGFSSVSELWHCMVRSQGKTGPPAIGLQ